MFLTGKGGKKHMKKKGELAGRGSTIRLAPEERSCPEGYLT